MLDHKDFLTELETLKQLRREKTELEAKEKELNETIGKVVHDLVEYMEATDQLTIKIKGLGTCCLTSTKFYNIDSEDPISMQAFETFVRGNGDWEMVTAIHARKVHGYYKERLELGQELPPGVKTSIKTNVTIRG